MSIVLKLILIIGIGFFAVGIHRYYRYIVFNFDQKTMLYVLIAFTLILGDYLIYRHVYPEILYESKEYRVIHTYKEKDGKIDLTKKGDTDYGVFKAKETGKVYHIDKVLPNPDGTSVYFKYVEFRQPVAPFSGVLQSSTTAETLPDKVTYRGILYVPSDEVAKYKQTEVSPKGLDQPDKKETTDESISDWEKSKTYLPSSSSKESTTQGPQQMSSQ